MTLRRLFGGGGTVAAVLLATATPALAEIRIGSTLAITGPASFLGDPEAKTLEMLVEEINAKGGVNGEPIRLIQYDDAADPNAARTFATRMIEDDEVHAVIGGSTTGTTMAMVELFEEAEIPFISLAGAVVIIDPVKAYTFKTPHTDRMACDKIFTDIAARGLGKVGMISGTGGFGASMRTQCLEAAPTHGIEVVADETYGRQDTDMTPQLTNIRNADGIEAVINPGFGQGPAIVTRNYRQLGIDLPLYQSHGVASNSFIDLAGEAAEGVRLPASSLLIFDKLPEDHPQKAVATAYAQAYTERTGEPVSTFGGFAYDAFQIVIQAIERAGGSDPNAIRDEIEKTTDFVGVSGIFTYAPDDHLGLDLSSFTMLEIQNGDWVIVE